MTSTTYTRIYKIICILGIVVLTACISAATMCYVLPPTYKMPILRLTEDLRIETASTEGDYILPRGTMLYYVRGMAEGHQLYLTYFYHKGAMQFTELPAEATYKGTLIAPQWLETLDTDAAKTARVPLSRADIAAAIQASGLTKRELADIIRTLPE